jgi:dihydroxyacetone kinase DhaKLM complex PTS-EIIA-like component DhaM
MFEDEHAEAAYHCDMCSAAVMKTMLDYMKKNNVDVANRLAIATIVTGDLVSMITTTSDESYSHDPDYDREKIVNLFADIIRKSRETYTLPTAETNT